MARKMCAALLVGVLLGVSITLCCQLNRSFIESPAFGQNPQPADTAPPELKPGVKVSFAGPLAYSFTRDEDPIPTIAQVKGKWILLDGPFRLDSRSIRGGWINFDQVTWYRVEPAKKEK